MYDNYITKEECNKAIKLYENENKFHKTFNRKFFEKASMLQKKDKQYFANGDNIDVWWEDLKPIIVNFDIALQHYLENTGVGDAYDNYVFRFTTLNPFAKFFLLSVALSNYF